MTIPRQHHPKGLSLKANFSWTFIGNMVNAACWFAMTIVLAKLGTPVNVGEFALGLAMTAPVFMFAALRLSDVQATDSKQEFLFGDYFALRLLTTAFAWLVVIAIVVVGKLQAGMAGIILATAASKSVEAISDALYGLFMQQERLDRIAKSMMMKGPLSLLGLTIGFALTHRVFWAVVGLTLGRAIVLVLYDFRNANASLGPRADRAAKRYWSELPRPRWHLSTLKKLSWLTLPLGFVTMLISFNLNIPRYLIEWHVGAYQLGIFAAVAAFQKSGPTLVQALGRSASPRLAKYYGNQDVGAFTRLAIKIVAIGGALGCAAVVAAVVAGRYILLFVYGPEYVMPGLFTIVMLAAAVDYVGTMLMFVITSARYYRVQLPMQLMSTATVALACYWLIPQWGLFGAGASLVLGNCVRVGGFLAAAWHAQRALRAAPLCVQLPVLSLQTSDA